MSQHRYNGSEGGLAMPSPFPGMDPYLESPRYWQDFHERFITIAAAGLQQQLPQRYRARISERLVLEATGRMMDTPTIFTRGYDAARYDLDLNYTHPPPATLSPPDLIWLEGWLREQGLWS
jgi:hypothetical protein